MYTVPKPIICGLSSQDFKQEGVTLYLKAFDCLRSDRQGWSYRDIQSDAKKDQGVLEVTQNSLMVIRSTDIQISWSLPSLDGSHSRL